MLFHQHNNKPTGTATGQSTPQNTSSNNINYGPPTQQEKDAAQVHKDQLANQSVSSNSSSSTGIKQVTPIITSINPDGASVYAYVLGVFEEGGTCTAVAQKGSTTITGQSAGFQNSNYTSCYPISFSTPLTKGSWSVTVNYSSSTAKGSSNPYPVTL